MHSNYLFDCSKRLQEYSKSVPLVLASSPFRFKKNLSKLGDLNFSSWTPREHQPQEDKNHTFLSLIINHCHYVSITESRGKSWSSTSSSVKTSRNMRRRPGQWESKSCNLATLRVKLAPERRFCILFQTACSRASHTQALHKLLRQRWKTAHGIAELEFLRLSKSIH